MSTTLLTGVNDVLKRIGEIAGDAGAISSFTDSSRQRAIDTVIMLWNEAVYALYALGSFRGEVKEGDITLVSGSREYDAETDFQQFAGQDYETRVLVNAENGFVLHEYKGGYLQMYRDQPDPSDYAGQPSHWALSEVNGKIRLDATPQSDQDGDIYTYLYEKRIALTVTTDTFPFPDTVYDSMRPMVAEVARNELQGKARSADWAQNAAKNAVKLLAQGKAKSTYGNRYR